MKGGVGKSTLAVNLAWQFTAYPLWKKNVLLVDLDPQFNSSQYLLGVEGYTDQVLTPGKQTVWDLFEQRTVVPGAAKPKPVTRQDAIVNVASFLSQDNRLDLLASRLELAWSLKNPASKDDLLERFLRAVDKDYDLVIIDCAPTESMLTTAAYLASHHVLIPVKPEFLSTIGLPLLARSLQDFHDYYDTYSVEIAGIVFNHASDYRPEEAKSKSEVRAEAKRQGWHVFSNEVRYSRSYPKGAREGRPIFTTSYSRSTAAANFHAFAQELATRIGI